MPTVSEFQALPYTKVLRRDEDGDVVATIAELDGCMAHGADEAEALQNLAIAQASWLEHAIAARRAIPLPTQEEELPSGKFLVRISRLLHQRLIKISQSDAVSLNQTVSSMLSECIALREEKMRVWRRAHPHHGGEFYRYLLTHDTTRVHEPMSNYVLVGTYPEPDEGQHSSFEKYAEQLAAWPPPAETDDHHIRGRVDVSSKSSVRKRITAHR